MVPVRFFNSILLIAASVQTPVQAAEVRGAVITKQSPGRHSVRTAVNVCRDEPAGPLHSDPEHDPLRTEPSRVIIHRFDPAADTPTPGAKFRSVSSLSKPMSYQLGHRPHDQTCSVAFVDCRLHPHLSATRNRWHVLAARARNNAAGFSTQSVGFLPSRETTVQFFATLEVSIQEVEALG